MVKVLRCSFCGANLELEELDDTIGYSEEFTPVGCTCINSKSPERQAFESHFGNTEIDEGIYLLEVDEEENES